MLLTHVVHGLGTDPGALLTATVQDWRLGARAIAASRSSAGLLYA